MADLTEAQVIERDKLNKRLQKAYQGAMIGMALYGGIHVLDIPENEVQAKKNLRSIRDEILRDQGVLDENDAIVLGKEYLVPRSKRKEITKP